MTRSDLAVRLPHRPGALAELGEALGRAGVSLEGGGGFVVGDHAVVHFLVGDGARAAAAVRAAGLDVLAVRDVLEQRLDQETPGQLGQLARAMADAGVSIDCVYSDHDHALIVCVDDLIAGARVSAAWRDRAAATADPDVAYIRASFVTAATLVRGRAVSIDDVRAWSGAWLPRPSYRVGDEPRFAPDWWRLHDDAGDLAGIRPLFERRYRAAADALGYAAAAVGEAWAAYLAGDYGVCLREVTPENIVAKARLVERLDRAIADPRPDDPRWCASLRAEVELLDGLTRRFAARDRVRFGRPTSRDRLIDGPRRGFPQVFAG